MYNYLGYTSAPTALRADQLPDATTISNFGYASNHDVVAYCWHSVPGYSQIGTYQGSNSADGPFIYTGFRPAFVLIKGYNGDSSWTILDSTRDIQNPVYKCFFPNRSDVEQATDYYGKIDILSNGFKCRSTGGQDLINFNNTWNYVYMAFAENPFKISNAR